MDNDKNNLKKLVTVDGKEVAISDTNKAVGHCKINSHWFHPNAIEAIHTALTCSDPLTAEKCVKLLEKMNNNKK